MAVYRFLLIIVLSVMYASGMSMSMIAKIVGVSVQTVSRWIRAFYTKKMDEIPSVACKIMLFHHPEISGNASVHKCRIPIVV